MLPQSAIARKYTKDAPLIYVDGWKKYPYSYIDEQGNPAGFSVELVRKITSQIGVPCEIRLLDQYEAHRMMRTGEADLTLGVKADYNDGYGLYGNTTIATFTNSMLLPQRDSTGLVTVNDLRQMPHISVVEGSRAYHYLKEYGIADSVITVVDNMDQYAQKTVAAGRGGIIWNTMMMRWWINKYEIRGYVVVPVDIPSGSYRFICNDKDVLQRMDSVAAQMQRLGIIASMEDRFVYPEQRHNANLAYYFLAGFIVISLSTASIVLIFNFFRRRSSHKAMRRILHRMTLTLQTTGVRVWVYYPATYTYTWVNTQGETVQEMLSFDFSKYYPDNQFNIIHEHVKAFLTPDGPKSADATVRCYAEDSKEVRIVDVHMQPMRDDYGNIYLVIGLQNDVTEQTQRKENADFIKQRYHAAFDISIGGIMCFDAHGVMTDINHRAVEILGAPSAAALISQKCRVVDFLGIELIGEGNKEPVDMHCCTTIHLADIKKLIPATHAEQYKTGVFFARGKEYDPELVRERRNNPNRYFYCHVISAQDSSGSVIGYRLYVRDITDEVQLHRATKKLHRRMQLMATDRDRYHAYRDQLMSEGGIFMLRYDPTNHLVYYFDQEKKQFLPLTLLRLIAILDKRDIKRARRVLERVDSRQPDDIHVTLRTRLRDSENHRRQFDVYLVPHFIDSGDVDGYFGFVRDITDLNVIGHLLGKATEKASEAERLQQNFLRNMSYSIRQPLLLMLKSIETYRPELPEAERQRLLDVVKNNTQRLVSLSNDTLLLSRLEAGIFYPNVTAVDFPPLFIATVNDTLDIYQQERQQRDVISPYNELHINADADVLRRILREAVALSASHTHNGTVSVRYYITRRHQLSILIEDNGHGIPPNELAHIFEIRPVDTTADNNLAQPASGLEIPICHALVKSLGGNMEIDSKIGEGTSIFINIPVDDNS